MSKPKIGILGLTLQLYKDKTPQMISNLLSFSDELKQTFSKQADIVHYPMAYNRETVDEAFSTFSESNVDGVILVFLSYSPSLILLPTLKKTNIPILILNTQKLEEITSDFSPKDSSANHGMHGVQDLSSVLLREKVRFSLITGYYKDQETLSNVSDWCSSAQSVSSLKKAKVGRIGGAFKDMGDFDMEPDLLKNVIGASVIEVSPEDLSLFKNFPPPTTNEVNDALDFEIEWDSNITFEHKVDSIKTFSFIKELSKKEGISAWAINFEGLDEYMPMPFLGISLLLKEAFGYGGEGDIFSSTLVLLAQILTSGKATFTEMFTTDYKNSRIYMTHMGESNLGLRRKDVPVKMFLNKMALGNAMPTIVPSFSIQPGSYTLINLAGDKDNKLKIIFSDIEVVDQKPFKAMKTPHFLIKPKVPVEEFLTRYSLQGGTHHLALASGDIKRKLLYFGFINNIETIQI